MKLIRRKPDPLATWEMTLTCWCSAVLSAKGKDLRRHQPDEHDYRESVYGPYWVICPACKKVVRIAAKDIPAPVRDRVRIVRFPG